MKGKGILGNALENLFTRQERMALLFLIGISLSGLALLQWRKWSPPRPPIFLELSVRVNAASVEELAGLPGIGPVLGRRIVENREKQGRFLTLDDLRRVKGVTSKTTEKIRGMARFD